MKIGAQLYNLRECFKNKEEFEQTLKKVSEIGFKYVQDCFNCAYEPEWFKEKLEKYGLKCIITHANQDKMLNDPEDVCNEHDVFGCKYIGVGSMPRLWDVDKYSSDEIYEKFKEEFLPVMKTFKEKGKYFMYHNHYFEFAKLESGKYIWDELVNEIPADLMGFVLDTYWIQYAGKDPAEEIEKLKGRIPCIHFKDYSIVRGPREKAVRYAPVGSGNLNWDKIISACEKAGVEYAFIEQDLCYGADPFECLKSSFEFLKSKGLEVE